MKQLIVAGMILISSIGFAQDGGHKCCNEPNAHKPDCENFIRNVEWIVTIDSVEIVEYGPFNEECMPGQNKLMLTKGHVTFKLDRIKKTFIAEVKSEDGFNGEFELAFIDNSWLVDCEGEEKAEHAIQLKMGDQAVNFFDYSWSPWECQNAPVRLGFELYAIDVYGVVKVSKK